MDLQMKKLKQSNNKIGSDIVNNIAEVIQKGTGLPVYCIDNSIPKQVLKIINSEDELRKLLTDFSDDELYREIIDFWTNYLLFRKPGENNKEALMEKLSIFIKNLGKSKKYSSYLFIPGIYQFPKVKFGANLEIVSFDSIKETNHLKDYVLGIIKEIKDVSKKDISEGLWLNFKFESPHSVEIVKYLKEELQSYLGIISLLCFGFPINQDLIIGIVKDEKKCVFIEPQYTAKGRVRSGWARFPNDIDKIKRYLDVVLAIVEKGKRSYSQIEKKVLLFAKLFFLANQTDSLEIKLIVLISALETLLLADQDQYYIGEKTAEKTALLLGKTYNDRIKIYKFVKSQYTERSNFIHKGEYNIKGQHIQVLERFSQEVFFKMLDYSKRYSNISGEKGLDAIFYQIKFNS